jgi:hypothetical protein
MAGGIGRPGAELSRWGSAVTPSQKDRRHVICCDPLTTCRRGPPSEAGQTQSLVEKRKHVSRHTTTLLI